MQSSDAMRREKDGLWPLSLCGPSFETRASALLRMRSSQAARYQTLMVRRRASAVSNHAGRTLSAVMPAQAGIQYAASYR